jgi:hypothetical protein
MKILRLQEELDDVTRKLREIAARRIFQQKAILRCFDNAAQVHFVHVPDEGNITEGRNWTWHDTPDDIAEAMLAAYPDKAERLGSALQNLLKSTTKKPR